MTSDGKRVLSEDELALARDELEVAELLCARGRFRVALTRVYFAVFHAARALLYAEGHEPRTHHGTTSGFSRQFVKTGRFEPATGRLLSRLQRFREDADYGEAFVADEPGTRDELAAAIAFVDRVAAELAQIPSA